MTGSASSALVGELREVLARASREADAWPAGLRFVQLALPPASDPLRAWDAFPDTEFASFWEAEDETVAGLGIAARGDPAEYAAPGMPRWFGALPFLNGWGDDDWGPIADVGFVLPRWTVQRNAEGVTACLAVRAPVEAADAAALERELARIVDAVAAPPDGERVRGARRFTPPDAWFARAFWEQLVERAIDEIREGRLDKVVLSRRIAVPLPARYTPVEVLARLRAEGSGPFRFGVRRGGRAFVGASPEYLFRKRGESVKVEALAGTFDLAADGADPPDRPRDLVRAAEHLFGSGKDLEEHALVVRGVIEALQPLARSVVSDEWPRVRVARELAHLSTTIRAFVEPTVTPLQLIEALHPTPAVCGLPREAAMRFLRRNEPAARGLFAAPIGWVDAEGDACIAVGIRAALMLEAHAWVYAGAGIVAASDPAAEWEETAAKLRWFAELASGDEPRDGAPRAGTGGGPAGGGAGDDHVRFVAGPTVREASAPDAARQ